MNIVLIGMRGSGKTTVGKALAQKLERACIDTDRMIEKKENQSIQAIVVKNGWDYFRHVEHDVITQAAQENNVVIATGGGVVENSNNIIILKKNSIIFYLKASLPTLMKRIKNTKIRPLVTNKNNFNDDMKALLIKRKDLYEKAAHEIINTDNLHTEEIVKSIIENLQTYEH